MYKPPIFIHCAVFNFVFLDSNYIEWNLFICLLGYCLVV